MVLDAAIDASPSPISSKASSAWACFDGPIRGTPHGDCLLMTGDPTSEWTVDSCGGAPVAEDPNIDSVNGGEKMSLLSAINDCSTILHLQSVRPLMLLRLLVDPNVAEMSLSLTA